MPTRAGGIHLHLARKRTDALSTAAEAFIKVTANVSVGRLARGGHMRRGVYQKGHSEQSFEAHGARAEAEIHEPGDSIHTA